MIFFDKVSKIYPAHLAKKENVVFKDIFFRVEKGEFVLITGKSGAGKTTLFRLLTGEEKPTKGKIYFEDKDLSKMGPGNIHIIRRKMGIIFQDYKLLSTKNVYENISYVMEALGFPDKEIEKNVPELLELVGLESKTYHYPEELSGGEKQRVAIARALVCNPDVILADEPTGNVDPYYTMDIVNLLLKINEKGTTILFATHDKDIVNSLDKRVLTLDDGHIVRDEMGGKFRL
ncbi:MAG: ATP-binding cassette domain-containing protein [Candidatus Pacebacteria bacterium]|nr:ATP-binding cassette domain-containing protein [Candidatus Paceibacterota bacterium]